MTTTQTATERTAPAHEGEGLLAQVMAKTRLAPGQDGYAVAERGVAAFIADMLKNDRHDQPVNKQSVDRMIAEIDRKLGRQIDAILHDTRFQALESAWRSVALLVEKTDFRANIRIDLLHVSKEELLEDFDGSPDVTQSGLYKHVYTAGYGQFGGQPVGCIVSNYTFGAAAPDIRLLNQVAAVGAMAHAPFLAAAGPEMLGLDAFDDLQNIKEVKDIFEGPRHAAWRALRESENARYLGLTMPRHLLRAPYDPTENAVRSFAYRETVHGGHDDYLWGNTAFLLATRIGDSFARYGWSPNIIGPQSGGAVEDLPVHVFESLGQFEAKIPTEVLISDRREYELAGEGFIPLTVRKESNNATFFSANSVRKPKVFPKTEEGQVAQTNDLLGTQLPYLFIVNRLAHYIKVLQREQIGSWKERHDLEREINQWLRQYVADQENPSADVRSRRPLRAARVTVTEAEGQPGWYHATLTVRPHFKYMGATFDLSLVGRLDKA